MPVTKPDNYYSMRKLPLLLLLLLIHLISYSQENFIPGYIINLKGDTVFGFINYRNWKTCPDKILFKVAPGISETEYNPSGLKGFSTAGRIYESGVVQIEISPINKNYLEYDPEFKFLTDTVFLQARFRGTKSLFLFIDNGRRDYFYTWNDTSFALLEYKRYLVKLDDRSHIYLHENKKYVGQLIYYLRDCQSLVPKIESTGYYTSSIEKLFKEYAKCTGEEYEFIRKNGERRTEFGFIAGVSLTWCSLSGNLDKYLESVNMGLSTNFSFGMLFDFFKFAKAEKWSWSNEFLVTIFNYEGQLVENTNENDYSTAYTTLGGGYVKWHSLARYKIPFGMFTLFANAGPSFGAGGLGKNQVYIERNFYGQMRYRTITAIEDGKSIELGLTGGIGIRIKRFTFESRYEFGSGFVDNEDLSSSANRVYLLLGIRL